MVARPSRARPVHGEPLGVDNVAALKVAFGMDKDVSFHIADDVYSHVHAQMTAGTKAYAEWEQMFQEYAKAYPELAREWEAWHTIPDAKALIANEALWAYNGKAATRSTSGEMINRLASIIPNGRWFSGLGALHQNADQRRWGL